MNRLRVRLIDPSPQSRILTCAICAVLLFAAVAQAAQLGRIEFPNSGPPAAQQPFINGVLLLHSFEYNKAREQFRTAQKVAPDFAMAYWGEAMAHNEPLWFAQNPVAARAVLKRAPKPATERERAYLRAVAVLYGAGRKEDRDLAYAAAMRRIHETYPDDHEAAAFYALALLGTAHGGRNYRTYMQAAAIAEEILAKNPEHPGALHYAIHCYDDPVHAPLGLRAARVYAKVAPASAHALHMPSHIFFALGMWDDAAKSNEASYRAATPEDAAYWHALWWVQYGYFQQGRYSGARALLSKIDGGSALARFHEVQMRAMASVEAGEQYTPANTAGLDAAALAVDLFATGSTALNRGDRGIADKALAQLGELRPNQPNGAHGGHAYSGDEQAVRIMEHELAAMILLADGRSSDAIGRMKAAVALEDKLPYEFGPPVPPKPAHELLGEMLLSLDQPKLARVQFELALQRAPKRALSLLGLARAHEQSGDRAEAAAVYGDLQQMWSAGDPAIRKAVQESLARVKGTPGNPSVP